MTKWIKRPMQGIKTHAQGVKEAHCEHCNEITVQNEVSRNFGWFYRCSRCFGQN